MVELIGIINYPPPFSPSGYGEEDGFWYNGLKGQWNVKSYIPIIQHRIVFIVSNDDMVQEADVDGGQGLFDLLGEVDILATRL